MENELIVYAWCCKCKKSVKMQNPEEFVAKNNRKMVKGICSECGTKVFRIIGMNPLKQQQETTMEESK